MSKIIDEAMQEMENISEDELSDEIKAFLDVLNENNLEILSNKEIYEILPQEIEENLKQLKKSNDVKLIAKYLKVAKFFSERSVDDIIYLWPVAVMFQLLNLRPALLSKILNEAVISKLLQTIFEFLNNVSISFNLSKAPFSEKQIFKLYQSGLVNENLNEVYYFIASLERGKEIYPNIYVNFLAQILLFKPSQYFNFLNSIEQPFFLVKFMNIMGNKLNKEYIDYLLLSENKWAVFEYLRQIFKDIRSRGLNDDKLSLISLVLEKLYDIDEEFFINGLIFLAKYKTKSSLGISTGKFFSKLNIFEVLEKLIDAFGVDDSTFHLDFWSCICETLERENKQLSVLMSKFVFHKWEDYLIEQFNSDKILTRLIFTGYKHIVILYLQECLKEDDSQFFDLLDEKLNYLIEYKSFWVNNPSRKRFIWFSYLYCMSMAWKNTFDYEINVSSLKDKVIFVFDDNRLPLSLPFNEDINTLIFEIKNNFGIMT
jgi:hypothetical protein